MDYAELVDAIQSYLVNEEASFIANIPMFVELAEKRVYQTVPVLPMRQAVVGSFTLNNRYLTLPDDWLSTDSLAVVLPSGEYRYLLFKEVEYIREAFPYPAVAGVPGYYGQFDVNTLLIGPTPDVSYTAEMYYMAYPESIVTASTTWLGDNFDFLLIYGALREAYLFMKGETDLLAEYEKKYQEGLILLTNHVNNRTQSDGYRPAQIKKA